MRRVAAVWAVVAGALLGWGPGDAAAPRWDAYAGWTTAPTILGIDVMSLTR